MKTRSTSRRGIARLRPGRWVAGAALAVALVGGLPTADAEPIELVTDGGFAANGWVSTTGFGSNGVTLWCNAAGGYVEQTIETVGGASHTLQWDWNTYGYFGSATSYLQVTVFDGVGGPPALRETLHAFASHSQYGFAGGYRTETRTFTPTQDTLVLRFAGTTAVNSSCRSFRWPASTLLDNASMTRDSAPPDADGDGVSDDVDNCVDDANPDQADNDLDGAGDVCDPDDDNDGISDVDEIATGTNPLNSDTDGDGVLDGDDVFPNSDPSPTVLLGGEDTGVPNIVFADGSTAADLIAQAQQSATNAGDFTSAVTQMANDWKKAGLITGAQKGALTSAAARS